MPLVYAAGVFPAALCKVDMHAVRHNVALRDEYFNGLLHGGLGYAHGAGDVYSVHGVLLAREKEYCLQVIFTRLIVLHFLPPL